MSFNATASALPILIQHNSGGFAFFQPGISTSSFFATSSQIDELVEASASFVMDTSLDNDIFFRVPATASGQNQDVVSFYISASGKEPRIGFGTKDPQSFLDIRSVSSSSPANIILRTNEDGVITAGEETGRIIFAIESSSFRGTKVITSGSVGSIFGEVLGQGGFGAYGKLMFSVNDSTGAKPRSILQLGYGAGSGLSEYEVFISASDLLHDDSAPQYIQKTDGTIISTLGFRDSGVNKNVGRLKINSASVQTILLDGLGGDITIAGAIRATGSITGNSIVGTLSSPSQTNITQVGTLDALTLGGDLDMGGNTLSMNNGEIDSATSIQSLLFKGNTDDDLTIASDGNITFKIDDDNDETGQSFKFQNDNTEVASINESGDLQLDGNITASGAISASGKIYGSQYFVDGLSTINAPSTDTVRFGFSSAIYNIEYGKQLTTTHLFRGSITGSSDISASGDLEFRDRKLSKTSTTDADHQGDVVFFGSTTSMDAGKIYYYNSSGNWALTDADAESSADGLLAVALGAASDTNGMLIKGMVTLDHDPGTVGDPLYLSTTAGQATSTAPNATDDIVRLIGYCLDSTNGQIYFNPSNDFIKHA